MAITLSEMNRLRRFTWSQLQAAAVRAGVPLGRIRAAETRDELRLAILEKLAAPAMKGRLSHREEVAEAAA